MLPQPRPTRPPLPTLVVEDSPETRELLTSSLATMTGLRIAATAETPADAIAAFERHDPTIVILDLGLRAGSGFDVLREIKRRAPGCRVLIYTGHDQDAYRTRCLSAGADFFFSKHRQHQELMRELEKLADPPPGCGV